MESGRRMLCFIFVMLLLCSYSGVADAEATVQRDCWYWSEKYLTPFCRAAKCREGCHAEGFPWSKCIWVFVMFCKCGKPCDN